MITYDCERLEQENQELRKELKELKRKIDLYERERCVRIIQYERWEKETIALIESLEKKIKEMEGN